MEQKIAQCLQILPEPLCTAVTEATRRSRSALEEIRLRAGSPAGVVFAGKEYRLQMDGRPVAVDSPMLQTVVSRAAGHSVYSVQDQIRQGFLTLPGGHRLGLCGTVVPGENGAAISLKDYSAINLRLARELPGIADPATNLLWSNPCSTLILGSPGRGKTTLLRDLIRQMSDRFHYRIGVVDERGELAASQNGTPQFQIGRQTDVLTGAAKAVGIEMVLRSMGPEWIAVDEITAEEDVRAIVRASYCGVSFLATAHAWCRDDLSRRPLYRSLMASGIFGNLIMLEADRSLRCERIENELR